MFCCVVYVLLDFEVVGRQGLYLSFMFSVVVVYAYNAGTWEAEVGGSEFEVTLGTVDWSGSLMLVDYVTESSLCCHACYLFD